jgi:WD40 repeat protein
MIEKSFTKSVVYDYVCDRRCTTTSFSTTKAFHSAIDHLPDNLLQQNEKPLLTQFYFDDDCSELYDRSLSNIYSVSFSPNFQKRLVVAGGDKGKVCVFPKETTPQQQQEDKDKEKEEQNEPLMSFHAHKGWISSVSLELSQSGRNLLLTSSNDATIKLWDLNEYSELTKTPKEIFHHQIHSSGIFSMHVQKKTLLIATGSKDTHVNISKLREDSSSSQIVRRYEDNTNVVKQVQWRDINCLGATGNDRDIRIYDIRSNENKASICIEDAHTQAINSLRWHPTNEYFLLSTAFDTCMHLFDIRKPKEPYNTIEEHMKDRKYTGIYHPCFLQGGDVIATGSTGTKAIMLFNTMDGGMISCGLLNNINAIYPDPYDSKVLVTTGRSMLYLKPFYDKYRHIRGVDDPVDYYNGYLSPKLMKEILNKGQ